MTIRFKKRKILLLFACTAVLGSLSAAEPQTRRKKLIEFGWDEPDPVFLRDHAAAMRKSPFDGAVFHVDYQREDGTKGSFTLEGWSTRRFTKAELEPSVQPMRDANLGEFRHNFLRFNTTPADVDWFDDYSAILENSRLAAWFAREAGCPGILFDLEQYKGKLFDYSKQRDAKAKSYAAYAEQAKLRGRQVMQAFQESYPGLTVFLTAGYSHPWGQTKRGKTPLQDVSYGLVPPFLDGMLEAAEGSARIVDGHEPAYYYTTAEEFPVWYRVMHQELLPIVSDATKYAKHFSFAFGIWMDKDSTEKGWSTEDFTKNGHTPESLKRVIQAALQASDEYVWIYSEQPRWWSPPNGASLRLPAAYDKAVRQAKAAGVGSATPVRPNRQR